MPAVKRTNDEWRVLLAEQRASGQTQPEWCEANGINLYTFRDRSSRLKKMYEAPAPEAKAAKPEQSETASAGWMDITPDKLPEKDAGIIIERGGFAVAVKFGFNADLLTDVLRAVNRACC